MNTMTRRQSSIAAFTSGEAAWFESFDPFFYEDDGSHSLNGLDRPLSELEPERRRWSPLAGVLASVLGTA